MSAALNNEELENSSEKRYRIQAAQVAELEAIRRELISTISRLNSHVHRINALREQLREEVRNGCNP